VPERASSEEVSDEDLNDQARQMVERIKERFAAR
jgi:enamine deaminase RidA (YjgF/YER057c/UK114 family)